MRHHGRRINHGEHGGHGGPGETIFMWQWPILTLLRRFSASLCVLCVFVVRPQCEDGFGGGEEQGVPASSGQELDFGRGLPLVRLEAEGEFAVACGQAQRSRAATLGVVVRPGFRVGNKRRQRRTQQESRPWCKEALHGIYPSFLRKLRRKATGRAHAAISYQINGFWGNPLSFADRQRAQEKGRSLLADSRGQSLFCLGFRAFVSENPVNGYLSLS